jgi:hypothetical protein
MQSIDQQAAASQTSGQPLSRNSRIQTPNSSSRAGAAPKHKFVLWSALLNRRSRQQKVPVGAVQLYIIVASPYHVGTKKL